MLKYAMCRLTEGLKELTMVESRTETANLQDRTKHNSRYTNSDNSLQDFSRYQIVLLFLTQLGYFPVAACLLTTAFFQPQKNYCSEVQNGVVPQADGQFFSLLMEWDMACHESNMKRAVSIVIMSGGLVGACIAGYMADRIGRRPVMIATQLIVSLGCFTMLYVGGLYWIWPTILLFVLGSAAGGYMVVNLTLVVEFLSSARSRLLVVSLNGWSISMTFVAALAYFSTNWWNYFFISAVSSMLIVFALFAWSLESVRWLASKNRRKEAQIVAEKIIGSTDEKQTQSHFLFEAASVTNTGTDGVDEEPKKYGLRDLVKYPSVRVPLLALTYCFISSSIVSFGFYFIVETIPGNKFIVMGVMGASKFILGVIPFVFSSCGRRPIVICSLGVACLSSYAIITLYFLGIPTESLLYTSFSLIAAASIDPTWKINHLYSAELFPTSVRSMSRGVCNMGARFGGIAAPFMVGLNTHGFILPYFSFTFLLTVQWLISLFFLPETKDKQLPDRLPEEIHNTFDGLDNVIVDTNCEKNELANGIELNEKCGEEKPYIEI